MKKTFLFLFFLVFIIGCTAPKGPTLTFTTPTSSARVSVELAETVDQWARGLMGRETLAENQGMLFIFPEERNTRMWMKDTKFPLDMIFMNKDYVIIDVKENFQTCTDNCEVYTAQGKPQYVLEVNAGFIQKNEIILGQKATFSKP